MKKLIWLVVLLPAMTIADDWAWSEVTDYETLKQAVIDNSSLKDPFSARFRDVFVRHIESTGATVWCGQINSKNSYGAYGGFQSFYYVYSADGAKDIEIRLLDPEQHYYEAHILQFDIFCKGTPYFKK